MTKRILPAAIVLAALAAYSAETLEVQLQRAVQKETAGGDLKAAIETYKKIAASAGSNHVVAAQALLHEAEAHQKLGDSDARKIYERIVREFGDQTQVVASARAALGNVAAAASVGKRRLCGDCGAEDGLSPDGRWMVLTDWENGDLAIRDMSNGQVKRLMTKTGTLKDDPSFAGSPAFSPDLRQIAFTWDTAGKEHHPTFRVMPNERGAKARVLVDDPDNQWYEAQSWSPDGKSILALITKRDHRTDQIARISVSDGSVKVLKSLGRRLDGNNGGSPFDFSPDGRWIVYAAQAVNPSKIPPSPSDPSDMHIYLLSVDGSRETEIVKAAGANGQPVWTPDGSHILFTSNRTGQWDLWSVAVKDGRAAGPEVLVQSGIGHIWAKGIHGGSYYYYADSSTSAEYVNILELAPNQKASSRTPRPSENFVGTAPAWSPDGKSIAFKRHHTGSNTAYDLVVRWLETGEEKAYPTTLGFTGGAQPLWAPDSKGILTGLGGSQPPVQGAYHVDLESGEWTHSTLTPPYNYVRRDTGIVAVDPATGTEKQIVTAPRAEPVTILLSPDQRSLAVWRSPVQAGRTVLAIVGADGSNYSELYTSAAVPAFRLRGLAWSKDSSAILFVQPTPDSLDKWRIMRIPARGGMPEFTGIEITERILSMEPSPDGSRLAFTTSKNVEELWALDNVLAEIK